MIKSKYIQQFHSQEGRYFLDPAQRHLTSLISLYLYSSDKQLQDQRLPDDKQWVLCALQRSAFQVTLSRLVHRCFEDTLNNYVITKSAHALRQ